MSKGRRKKKRMKAPVSAWKRKRRELERGRNPSVKKGVYWRMQYRNGGKFARKAASKR